MANVTAATKFFPQSKEGFATTVGTTFSAGAATVVFTGLTGYTDGDLVVLVINPASASAKDVVVGTKSGNTLTGCVWTEGPVGGHSSGETVVDYVTATHWDLLMKGLAVSINTDGTLKTAAVLTALGAANAPTAGWSALSATLTYAGNNGNGEYLINTSGDLTSYIAVGTKISVNRGTAPPTQAISLAVANSQYASKTAPTGITFSAAFTCESWVYPNSLLASSTGTIVSRFDGTNGFGMRVNTANQISIFYGNGTYTDVFTQQALPVKRWSHVAGVVASVASKTVSIYVNGTSWYTQYTSSSSAAFTQSGPLQVGGLNGGSFFDGYILEPRIWSAAQTQAQIQANMNIITVGNETNLVFALTAGTFTDKTSNSNNLTASGGAVANSSLATLGSSPMNTTEYVVVTKATSSQLTVLAPVSFSNIPNMSLTTPQYSNARAPYNFPASKDKWRIEGIFPTATNATAITQNVITRTVAQLTMPTGEWIHGFQGDIGFSGSGSTWDIRWWLQDSVAATLANGSSPYDPGTSGRHSMGFTSSYYEPELSGQGQRTYTAITTSSLYIGYFNAGGTSGGLRGIAGTILYAESMLI